MSPERSLPRVVVVDDEPIILESWRETLGSKYEVALFLDPLAAAKHVANASVEIDVALIDLRMPGMDGMTLMRHVREKQPMAEVILVTGHGTIPLAVDAIQLGAYDFLQKPIVDLDAALLRIDRAIEHKRLRERNAALSKRLQAWSPESELVGDGPAMRRLRTLVDQIADAPTPVMLRGEAGTGKELVARALHARGPRRERPFLTFDAASVGEELCEGELFGWERGAVPGAENARLGLLEAAEGGVLFLTEIADLPARTQVRLVDALQEGEFRPLGATRARKVDTRVVAASRMDLERLVREGRFREDLLLRLSTLVIELPPLRERKPDLPLLARHLLDKHARRVGRDLIGFSDAALEALVAYPWPGNARELETAIEHAAVLATGSMIELQHLPSTVTARTTRPRRTTEAQLAPGTLANVPYAEARTRMLGDFERRYLLDLLELAEGNLSEAARRSGIDRSNLRRILRKAGLLPGGGARRRRRG